MTRNTYSTEPATGGPEDSHTHERTGPAANGRCISRPPLTSAKIIPARDLMSSVPEERHG